jgi:uncharacterized protein YecE (DUF72 family)
MTDQLSLFGAEEPPPKASKASKAATPAREPAPAVVDADTAALGAALPPSLYLGTSSWAFPGWAGLVYAEAMPESLLSKRGLLAYGRHPLFRTVGLDRSFYAPLAEAEYAAYAAQVPEQFRFVTKATNSCTDAYIRGTGGRIAGDNPRFLDAALVTEQFVGPCSAGLGSKAGPLVFQFSPMGKAAAAQPERFADRLHAFLEKLPQGPLYAVELRDPALLTPQLVYALNDTGARYCVGINPRMPGVQQQLEAMYGLAPGPLVARWNLHAGYAYEEAKEHYRPFTRLVDEDPESREALADACVESVMGAQPAFVTANNKAEGSSPLSMAKLAKRILEKLAKA